MSDASEVKRFIHWFGPDYDGSAQFSQEVVLASDFDRIMSERDELWKRATKFVMPGEMDTGESIEHYVKTLEQTVAELRAELANRDANERSWLVAKEIELGAIFVGQMSEMEETIARQARVIEKLKSYAKHRVDCICRAGVLEYSEECDCGLAAIEKEGTKDE